MNMDAEKYFIELRKRAFKSPNSILSIAVVLAILLIYYLLIRPNLYFLLFLLLFPYIALIIIDFLTFRLIKLDFPLRRITLLEEIVFIVSFVAFLIFILIFLTKPAIALLLGFSISPFLRYLFLKPFLKLKEHQVIIVSLNYSFSISIFFIFSHYPLLYLIPFYISSILFALVSRYFLIYLSKEFKEEYGEDPIKYAGVIVNYFANQNFEEAFSINNLLSKMYSIKEIPVMGMVVKNKENKIKGIIVFPYVHPGPFGEVGCSNLPLKLKNKLSDLSENILVFHTTSTHDENCAGEEDIEKIAKSIKNSIHKLKFKNTSSERIRIENDFEFFAQKFGDSLFLSIIPSKNGFDDVSLELGMKIRRRFLNSKTNHVFVVDAHNNFNKDYSALKDIDLNFLNGLKEKLSNVNENITKCGFSNVYYENDSLGPMGIQTFLVDNGKKVAYILFDGNNMEYGLRNKIIEELKKYVDDVELFTTDNHIVNLNPKDLNPVGSKGNIDDFIKKIKEGLDLAQKDLEECSFAGFTTKCFLKVAGKGYVEKVSEIIKRMLKRLRIAVILVILTLIFSFFIFLLTFIFI